MLDYNFAEKISYSVERHIQESAMKASQEAKERDIILQNKILVVLSIIAVIMVGLAESL